VTADAGEAPKKPKNARACGSRFELECKKEALARGLQARKHAMSGSLDEKGDITITSLWGQEWVGECKWRKTMPAWFVECLGDHSICGVQRGPRREAGRA
jgi:hypothetical protein